MSVQLVLTVLAVLRCVAVRTTANATIPMECVCVSQDIQGRHVTSDCALKNTMASSVIGGVHATTRTHAGMQKLTFFFSLLLQIFQNRIFSNTTLYLSNSSVNRHQEKVFMCCLHLVVTDC